MSESNVILVMCLFFFVFISIDIGLAVNKREGDTYSEIIRGWARKRIFVALIFAFGMGLLCGHWFWSPVIQEKCEAVSK